jgi:hypothetical protein
VRRTLSSEQWRAIEKALPSGIDRTRLRSELDRALHLQEDLPPEQQRQLQRLERELDRTLTMKVDGIGSQAVELRRACVVALRRPQRFSLQYRILWAYESAGGDCRISTPRRHKDEARWPEPMGDVVRYFQAAAKVAFGKSPGAERIKDIVSLYRHLNFNAASLAGASGLRANAVKIEAKM